MSVNKVILLGNVGNDPEHRTFENGNTVANFSLATSETWKNKAGEKQTKTEWHNIAVFGKLTGVVEAYVSKGMQLYIEGKIETRKYEDKEGNTRYVTNVVLNGFGDVLQMVGKKSDNEAAAATPEAQQEQPSTAPEPEPEDDLPF